MLWLFQRYEKWEPFTTGPVAFCRRSLMLWLFQRYEKWEPFTTRGRKIKKEMKCCDCFKDTKNESHSQHYLGLPVTQTECCDCFKDTKNESHSQLLVSRLLFVMNVVTVSKIRKMRAIHNSGRRWCSAGFNVVTVSKIRKMRAIHNQRAMMTSQ